VEFRILGPLEVWQDGCALSIGSLRARSLLVILLLHPNQVLARDDLIERLWDGRPPRTAKAMLQNAVSVLRHALGAEALETVPPGYRLSVEPENLDSLRFVALVEQARDAEPEVQAKRLRDALACWRGPPLSDYPFAGGELLRLDELRLYALEQRIDADLALGRSADLVAELEGLLATTPLRERLWEQLMLALYRSGRQAEALACYRRAHNVFVDRLGIEPGSAMKELQRAILIQDPRLETMARIEPVDLLERAAPILPTGFVDRAQSLYDYGVALFRLGEHSRAAAALERAEEQARLAQDPGLEELVRLTLSQQANWTGVRSDRDHLDQVQHSVEVFERSGDERKLAKALLERGLVLGDLGSSAKGEPDIQTAIELAKETGDRWQEGWSRNMLAFSNWSRGSVAVEDALESCTEHLAAFDWGPPGPLGLWSTLGYLHAQAGHTVEALTWAQRAVDATREGGIRGELGAIRRRMAASLVLTGDEAGAEVELRAAHDLLASISPTDPWLSRARAELAFLACRRGELREAEVLLAAARHPATDDLESRALWLLAAALVDAENGRTELALERAEGAVRLVSETDWLDLRAETLETLALVGGPSSARDAALELATLRGNVVVVARIRELR
jgi:DNA-binding SARP family transcriptional activator